MAKYLKIDSELGYVEDVADIEYLKFNNMRHAVLGNMLGDYDSEGNYVVDPEIVKELIGMRKYIVESIDNIDICVSELKLDKQISFLVTFEGERATLTLVEKLSYEANYKTDSGIYSNLNEYLLDSVETSGEVDKSIIYRRWNISQTEGNVLDIFSMDEETIASLYKIANRFKTNLIANKVLMEKEEEIEEIEAGFAVDVFEILARYPKLKKAVDESIKQSLSENSEFIRIDKPNFAKTLNEVIVQKIEENLNVLTDEEKKDFNEEFQNAKVDYTNRVKEELQIHEEYVKQDKENIDEIPHTIIRIDTENVEQRSLQDCAKEFVEAEKKTKARVEDDAVVVLTGKENKKQPVTVDGQPAPQTKRSALAKTIITAVATGAITGAGVGALGALAGLDPTASRRAALIGALAGAGVEIAKNVGKKTKETVEEVLNAGKTAEKEDAKSPDIKKEAVTNKSTASKTASAKKPEKKKEASKGPAKKKAGKGASATPSSGGSSGGGGSSSGSGGSSKPRRNLVVGATEREKELYKEQATVLTAPESTKVEPEKKTEKKETKTKDGKIGTALLSAEKMAELEGEDLTREMITGRTNVSVGAEPTPSMTVIPPL